MDSIALEIALARACLRSCPLNEINVDEYLKKLAKVGIALNFSENSINYIAFLLENVLNKEIVDIVFDNILEAPELAPFYAKLCCRLSNVLIDTYLLDKVKDSFEMFLFEHPSALSESNFIGLIGFIAQLFNHNMFFEHELASCIIDLNDPQSAFKMHCRLKLLNEIAQEKLTNFPY